MPTASRSVRKNRRIKRNQTLAYYKVREIAQAFEQLRAYAQGLKAELDLRDKAAETPEPAEKAAPLVTITRLPDEEEPEALYDDNGNLKTGV